MNGRTSLLGNPLKPYKCDKLFRFRSYKKTPKEIIKAVKIAQSARKNSFEIISERAAILPLSLLSNVNRTVRQSDSGSQRGIMGNTRLIRVIINRLLKSLQEKLVR